MKRPLPSPYLLSFGEVIDALSPWLPRYAVRWLEELLGNYSRQLSNTRAEARRWQQEAADAKRVLRDKADHARRLEDQLLQEVVGK